MHEPAWAACIMLIAFDKYPFQYYNNHIIYVRSRPNDELYYVRELQIRLPRS